MTDKLISLQAAKNALSSCAILEWEQLKKCYPMLEVLEELPSAQPTQSNDFNTLNALDCISRQAAIAKFEPWLKVNGYSEGELNILKAVLFELTVMPPAVSSSRSHENDLISRQAAVDAVSNGMCSGWDCEVVDNLKALPSAQPDTSRIENILHGKSPEEQYDFLWWLMRSYGMQFSDTRIAVIEWLRGERNG